MRIVAVDQQTNSEQNNVNLSFTCGRYTCDIGRTRLDLDKGNIPLLEVDLPQCTNAVLRANKKDYEEGQIFMQTEIEQTYRIPIQPVKELQIEVKKFKLNNNQLQGPLPLANDEQATITIRYPSKKFESFAIHRKEDKTPLKFLAKAQFDYDVEVYLADEENIKGGFLGNWSVNPAELRLGNKAIINVIEQEFTDDDEAYLFYADLPELSKKLPDFEITR